MTSSTPEPTPPLTAPDPEFARARNLWARAEEQRDDENAPYLDTIEALSYHVPDLLADVDRLREENADLETRRLGWKIAAETGVDTIRELRAELEAVKDARAAEADEYVRQLRALPGWCRACPPGCASCLGPDCECYEHQDRESATTPPEGDTHA